MQISTLQLPHIPDWTAVRAELDTIAEDYYQMVLLLRFNACLRYYWRGPGSLAEREDLLRQQVLLYAGFKRGPPKGINPEGYGDSEHIVQLIAWARGSSRC